MARTKRKRPGHVSTFHPTISLPKINVVHLINIYKNKSTFFLFTPINLVITTYSCKHTLEKKLNCPLPIEFVVILLCGRTTQSENCFLPTVH